MNLEKRLAGINRLSEQLYRRSLEAYAQGSSSTNLIGEGAKAIQHEAQSLAQSFMQADKKLGTFLTDDEMRMASLTIGNIALSAKNLAEQVNMLIQRVYGDAQAPKFKNLELLRDQTPEVAPGLNMVDYFYQVHDHKGPVFIIRNVRGHEVGHNLLTRESGKYQLVVSESQKLDAVRWINSTVESYLSLAHTVLVQISKAKHPNLKSASEVKTPSYAGERLRMMKREHSKPVAVALAGILLGMGSIGTIAYQQISAQQKQIQDGQSIRSLLSTKAFLENEYYGGDAPIRTVYMDRMDQSIDYYATQSKTYFEFSQRMQQHGLVLASMLFGKNNSGTIDFKAKLDAFDTDFTLFESKVKELQDAQDKSPYSFRVIAALSSLKYAERDLEKSAKVLADTYQAHTRGGMPAF